MSARDEILNGVRRALAGADRTAPVVPRGYRDGAVAADLVEHTADLGGTTVLGGISAFGVDAAGELYIVNYSAGTILKIVGAPSAPTNVRITR